ncbi:MAG: 2-succinyl-6-hydroxy-2,4-cyclohexadiene-carboxylic acid synthase/2-oxoglutarate decarboxylase [Thermomicrobiales bacterium]|nr:2-succinyl-6-hydroxy-2,4-cyclohexadiene-carboxylic acid synthase/2-oxoglutarate decarboxylase [Thermomicrobiales bacterium]
MTLDSGMANLELACALVEQLATSGVRHAVICPGSRSTPMAVSLASRPEIESWVLVDERAAAYFALGMARQLASPVVILSTSGTAAANFLPAVVEARLSRIPLIVLTADRPPELRDWGAAQTIDQIHLFGSHVKWFFDMPVPDGNVALARHARATAARAVQTARSEPAGPIHLNVPFREPLLPADLGPTRQLWPDLEPIRRTDSPARTEPSQLVPVVAVVDELASQIAREPRGIIVCGPGEVAGLADAASALSAASGYPILADPIGGVRFGPHDRAGVVDAYDAFLRDQETAEALQPEIVIRVGALPTSKPLQQFLLARTDRLHVVIDSGAPRDPSNLATSYVLGDAAVTLANVAEVVTALTIPANRCWLDAWKAVDRATAAAIESALALEEDPFEGRAAAEVAALLPEGATLVVGNSMPIRDVDAFVRGDQRRLRIVSNRGANGIDGVISSALGAAAVAAGPVVLLIGDLSFLHDLNGLLAASKFGLDATVVVLNNDGGGIFSFLPQAEQLDATTFESLFGTPTGFDVAAAARLFGASYARPGDWGAFRRELCRAIGGRGLAVIELATDRERNVTQHRAVWAAVVEALRRAVPVEA